MRRIIWLISYLGVFKTIIYILQIHILKLVPAFNRCPALPVMVAQSAIFTKQIFITNTCRVCYSWIARTSWIWIRTFIGPIIANFVFWAQWFRVSAVTDRVCYGCVCCWTVTLSNTRILQYRRYLTSGDCQRFELYLKWWAFKINRNLFT